MERLSYKSLKDKVTAPNYLTDIKKFEVYFSLICASTLSILLYLTVIDSSSNEIVDMIDLSRNMLLNSTFGLLGLLGFIISGLAIITGTMGNKVTKKMIKDDKYNSLLSILFSFVYLGRFIGILIVTFLIVYFSTAISLPFNLYFFIGISFVLSYYLFFSVFFAGSLLITCINIYQLNFIYSKDDINVKSKEEIDVLFNDVRVDALTSIIMKKNGLNKEELITELIKRINSDCPDEYKELVIEKVKKYYHF